ncbi:unnamed protein product [Sphagnum jensenii]|uniref:Uncharacterized protein n=1 Tax=Sphagnum jensenii TaxID=128206 RepID=A0ABP1AMS4_9BRYO
MSKKKNNQVEETSSGPIVREETSPEHGLPQLEDSSIIPAKGSDVNATFSAVSQVVQARTDAVIGGGGRKALGLGFSSRIDTATTSSPRAMGGNNKKKQISRAPALAVLSGTVSGRGRCRSESDSVQVSEIILAEDLDSTSEEVESTISSSSNSGLHRRSRKLATMMSVDENSSLLSAAAPESDEVQKVCNTRE